VCAGLQPGSWACVVNEQDQRRAMTSFAAPPNSPTCLRDPFCKLPHHSQAVPCCQTSTNYRQRCDRAYSRVMSLHCSVLQNRGAVHEVTLPLHQDTGRCCRCCRCSVAAVVCPSPMPRSACGHFIFPCHHHSNCRRDNPVNSPTSSSVEDIDASCPVGKGARPEYTISHLSRNKIFKSWTRSNASNFVGANLWLFRYFNFPIWPDHGPHASSIWCTPVAAPFCPALPPISEAASSVTW
jgi:hypothetical protein